MSQPIAMQSLKFIVLYPRCGLGNRFRAMACAYALSKVTNADLYINWEPTEDCAISWTDMFVASFPMPRVSTDELSNKYPNTKVFFNDKVHTDVFLDTNVKTKLYEGVIISGGHDFKHPLMSANDFLFIKHTYYQLLFSNLLPSIKDEISTVSNIHDMIGVHMRIFIPKYDTADKYDFENDNILDMTTLYMNNSRIRNKDTRFFVSCNDPKYINILRDMFGHDTIVTYHGLYHEDDDRNSKKGIVNAIVNMILLSQTKAILGTYRSSFSDEAAIIGFIPKLCTSNKQHSEQYHCYGYEEHNKKSYIMYSLPVVSKLFSEL